MSAVMRRRPTAFEVSFPDELQVEEVAGVDGKRKGNAVVGDGRMGKRPVVSGIEAPKKVVYYLPRPNEVPESSPNLIIPAEDPDGDLYGYNNDANIFKPTRTLTDFAIFDPGRQNELVSLKGLEEDGAKLEAAGYVSAAWVNGEDAGQEDDGGDEVAETPFVRLGPIVGFRLNYDQWNEPIQIETDRAVYQLNAPSRRYQAIFRFWYKPHRITQLVISSAISHPDQTYDQFLEWFCGFRDVILGGVFVEADLFYATSYVRDALGGLPNGDELSDLPVVEHILTNRPSLQEITTARQRAARTHHFVPRPLVGNLDLAVLRAESQNATHVTPLIATLASGFFNEQLVVVGPPPLRPNRALVEQRQKLMGRQLRQFVYNAHKPLRKVGLEFHKTQRLKRGSLFYKSVDIDHHRYTVGDYVVTPKGEGLLGPPPEIPSPEEVPLTATVPDYFWFGKIIFINSDAEKAHVQWLSHGSAIHLEEAFDPQELFLTDICDSIDLRTIAGKVTVHRHIMFPHPAIANGEFFYKLVYDEFSGSFTQIDDARLNREARVAKDDPPNSCPVCSLVASQNQGAVPEATRLGVRLRGVDYHLWDFVFYYEDNGPCEIGYIIDVQWKLNRLESSATVHVKRVGRISSLSQILPPQEIRDERHLFMTDEISVIPVTKLIRVCYVWPAENIRDPAWLSISPDHFYIRYKFESLNPLFWEEKQLLDPLKLCEMCTRAKVADKALMSEFLESSAQRPLRTLDLFAGSGAFGLAMAESRCIKVTHAIEISPSAAKTLRQNSPGTVIYNQCASIVLRYIIKSKEGHAIEVPRDIPNENPIPPPFNPEDIDCIIGGFPCQPHSTLNMWKRADDPKSNSILVTLAYVDFIRPKWAVFENVRGFLQFSLKAKQAGPHRLEGGMKMGGIKFLESALIRMGYQVQATLLQSGHYGAPQGRVRFFLFAAKIGYPLPSIPQPTHDFPENDALAIKFPNGQTVRTVMTMRGTAPQPQVTIDDAISDLPWFDWKDPVQDGVAVRVRRVREDGRLVEIPALRCDPEGKHCGYTGNVPYRHAPRNSFQAFCRRIPTQNLQHITRILVPKKIERVVNIPLDPGADYRSLPPRLWNEWLFTNPFSAIAQKGFRPGLYGRLDKDSYFPTTVTNMDPTAKQCRVLNPYCKRMVTVRELARSQGFPDSFVFQSITNDVVTMHRQIGNAVSWPVGRAIGMSVRDVMFQMWKAEREDEEGDAMAVD